ncbi:hypothetical protein HB364_06855 [Pseudoflavitalea sp. X16]|uniref:FHIPEP family type III secretion protein n=1 Tax=Paraflavitalea devenefica TaxID=2716334 RepID=UPI00142076BC|nr:FHIPEP family type III secretion protein [Paraflavitalea devenefica]NII24789.1 hypothetical protein [Paraflavitalea devenefica]
MILIRISKALFDLAGREATTQEVLKAVGRVQGYFLLPDWRLQATIESALSPDVPACFIHSREADYPADLPSQVFYYCRQSPIAQVFSPAALTAELMKSTAGEVQQFITVFIEQVLIYNRHLLINEDAATVAWKSLYPSAVVPDDFTDVLQTVLKQGIGLTDQQRLCEVFNESLRCEWPADVLAENLINRFSASTIAIHFPEDWFDKLNQHLTDNDKHVFKYMREDLFYELGILYPEIRFVMNNGLPDAYFQVQLNDVLFLPVKGLQPVSPWTFITQATARLLRDHASFFITCSSVGSWLNKLAAAFPDLVRDARVKRSAVFITRVLRLLVAEEISIRHLPQILQSILEFDYVVADGQEYIVFDVRLTTRHEPGASWLNDPVNTCSFVRTNLKHYISHKHTQGQSVLPVYLLDPDIERQLLADILPATDAAHIKQAISALLTNEQASAAILTTNEVRPRLRQLIASTLPKTPVLAYQELAASMNIKPLERITLP